MSTTISITGLSKAAVLSALFNQAKTQGLGTLHHQPAHIMSEEEAQALIDVRISAAGRLAFDYLEGRVLKVDLTHDTLDVYLYDRDNGGAGTAARIIERVREKSLGA